MIKGIFYDFDGVIKESTQIKTEAFYALYLPYGEEIAEKVKQHHLENGGVSRFEKFRIYHKELLDITLTDSELTDLANQFSKLVMQKVIESQYVDGAVKSLNQLNENFEQFIVTGTPQKEIEVIVKELGIETLFKRIYGSPENKIQISQHIIDEFNFKPSEVVFIGDATTDFKAAKHHKFHFVLRTHSENIEMFEDYSGIKVKDLINLQSIIKTL